MATALPTRWSFVDALRGVAIAGILFVNVPDLVQLGYGLTAGSSGVAGSGTLDYLVQTRFVPIFTLLFGVSMTFIRDGANNRGRRAWVALLVRLAALFAIGLAHALVYPGEVLREYAVSATLVLPVVLFTPRLAQLLVGLGLLVAADVALGGGLAATPGLMLIGAALAAFAVPRALQSGARGVAWAFALASTALVPTLWWQSTQPGDPRFSTGGVVAGQVMALWYVSGLSLLWQTPARRVIAAAFDPLGRMALTNYVGASLVVWLVAREIDFRVMDTELPAVGLAASILVVQSVLSRWWLGRFSYGPLEWVWRMATWRQRVPLRRLHQG